jgi:hypothetical protein
LLTLAVAAGVDLTSCTKSSSPYKAFTDHERAVVEEATARLIPGPTDDPTEAGHPGAREAGVVDYINGLLGALRYDKPLVYGGGPFSNRSGNSHDDMADFLPLNDALRSHWKARVDGLTTCYRAGIPALDRLAGGDFTKATKAQQDAALAKNPKIAHLPQGATGFTDVLFQHAIEGCYAVPEYGGNHDLVGWKEIKFAGDRQPKGYTDAQVSQPDPPDPLQPAGIVDKAVKLITATAPGSPSSPTLIRPGG